MQGLKSLKHWLLQNLSMRILDYQKKCWINFYILNKLSFVCSGHYSMFSKKATKIDEIFTVELTVTTYCQIDSEEILPIFVAFSENVNFNSDQSAPSDCQIFLQPFSK